MGCSQRVPRAEFQYHLAQCQLTPACQFCGTFCRADEKAEHEENIRALPTGEVVGDCAHVPKVDTLERELTVAREKCEAACKHPFGSDEDYSTAYPKAYQASICGCKFHDDPTATCGDAAA